MVNPGRGSHVEDWVELLGRVRPSYACRGEAVRGLGWAGQAGFFEAVPGLENQMGAQLLRLAQERAPRGGGRAQIGMELPAVGSTARCYTCTLSSSTKQGLHDFQGLKYTCSDSRQRDRI